MKLRPNANPSILVGVSKGGKTDNLLYTARIRVSDAEVVHKLLQLHSLPHQVKIEFKLLPVYDEELELQKLLNSYQSQYYYKIVD